MYEDKETESVEIDEDEELSTWAFSQLKDARMHFGDWRKKAHESFGFYATEQWSDDDKAALEEQDRPIVTFNRVARTINAIAGLEVQNRQEVRYLPREMTDTTLSDVFTQVSKWVRDNTDAEDEESEAFQDMLICGVGWTETRMDYEVDPEGKVDISRLDPMEMLYDHNAKKKNADDSKWRARVKDITPKEFRESWPDAEVEPNTFWFDGDETEHDATNAFQYKGENVNDSKDRNYSVIQFQWWDRVCYYRVQIGDRTLDISEERHEKLGPLLNSRGFKSVKMFKRVYKQAFLSGKTILEQTELKCNDFTLRCMTGMRDRNKNVWYGVVELMKDPQRWANKWLSQTMHIVNSNAKGGLLAEEDAFADINQAEDSWSKADGITWVTPGGLGKIEQKQPAQFPQGLDRLMSMAMEAISDIPGVNAELLGTADRFQAGYLELSRKQAGVTILATYFDALRRYRKEQGRVLASYIKDFIADGRVMRILGPQGDARIIPLLRDQMSFKYDIIVDDSPTSPNMKERVFSILTEMLPMIMQSGGRMIPEVFDYSPLPEPLIQKWKQAMSQQPDPIAEMLKKLTIAEKQADIRETESKTVKNYADAQESQAVAQDEMAQAQQKAQGSQIESAAKADAYAREERRKNIAFLADQQRKEIAAKEDLRRKQIAATVNSRNT